MTNIVNFPTQGIATDADAMQVFRRILEIQALMAELQAEAQSHGKLLNQYGMATMTKGETVQ